MSTSSPDPATPQGRSGPRPALIAAIVLVVVGLVAGGVVLATSSGGGSGDGDGGDGGERAADQASSPQEPEDSCGDETPCPTGWEEMPAVPVLPNMSAEKALPLAPRDDDSPVDQAAVLDQVVLELGAMLPIDARLGQAETECLASAVLSVAGPALAAAYDDHFSSMADVTTSSQDLAIGNAAASCVPSEAMAVLRDDPNGIWPDAWTPGGSAPEAEGSGAGGVSCGSYQAGSAEIVVDLGVYIYCQTPAGVTVQDAACLAAVVVAVVGEEATAASGYSAFLIHTEATSAQDDQIAAGVTSCLTPSTATTLRDDDTNDYWPDPWTPTP